MTTVIATPETDFLDLLDEAGTVTLARTPVRAPVVASAPRHARGRPRSRKAEAVTVCEGWDGSGCPEPGCPGSAMMTVIARPDADPVIRQLCNWCWIRERTTFALPCSVCGGVAEHLRQFSRYWHIHSLVSVKDFCGTCFKPMPGACMGCIFGSGPSSNPDFMKPAQEGRWLNLWTELCKGRIPAYPGDCECWRPDTTKET